MALNALQHGIRTNPSVVVPIQNNRVIWNLVQNDEHISIDFNGQRVVVARPGGTTTQSHRIIGRVNTFANLPDNISHFTTTTANVNDFVFVRSDSNHMGNMALYQINAINAQGYITWAAFIDFPNTALSSNGNGISRVYADGETVQGDGSINNPLHATQIIFNTMPTIQDLIDFGMTNKTRFLVRSIDTGIIGGIMPSGDTQKYTYVYRQDEVIIHPESANWWFNLLTVDAPWAEPIIAANEAAGRFRYEGIKITMQLPENFNPQWQTKLALNKDVNDPFDILEWKSVSSLLGGYEASYLKPHGVYDFTFVGGDVMTGTADIWRVDHDGMYRIGG